MRELIVVSGTGTGVGKTWAAARLISELRKQGPTPAARKPVQSFDPAEGLTDADVLAAATQETPTRVCPPHRSYALAMAPPMAAAALGMPPFTISEIVAEIELPDTGLVFVEGVGGPRSPLAHDGDTVALAAALHADRILLVARPGLGTINEVLLSADAFDETPMTVFLNRFDPTDGVHRANRDWLTDNCGLDVAAHVDELTARYTTLEVS